MEKFKVTCTQDNQIFIVTSAFSRLHKKFKGLKTNRGRIIHITGSPGTGKSSNIYHSLNLLDLKFYDAELKLKNLELSSTEVFEEFINTLKIDFNVKTKEEAYNELSKYDMILFADKLLDYGDMGKGRIELSEWLRYNRLKSIIVYLKVIYECLKYFNYLKRVNLVFHTTLTFIFKNKKYDVLSDFGILSKILMGILKLFFEVVEIKYTDLETIEIINSYFEGITESQIREYIQKYGNRPRYILKAIDDNLISLKASNANIRAIERVCRPDKL